MSIDRNFPILAKAKAALKFNKIRAQCCETKCPKMIPGLTHQDKQLCVSGEDCIFANSYFLGRCWMGQGMD